MDHTSPHFQSKETETMFILTAHLRGYRRENVKVDINEDGTMITIGGEKPVEEMIMVGLKVYKKGIEMRKLRKAFRIPDGVILDNIKAEFNEDEYTLNILMPKKVKGIIGIEIQEMKETELDRMDSETLLATADKIPKRVTFKEEQVYQEEQQSTTCEISQDDDRTSEAKLAKHEMKQPIQESQKPECCQIGDQVESSGLKQQKDQHREKDYQVRANKENGIQEEVEETALKKTEDEEGEQEMTEEPHKKSKTFAPLIAGSALLLALVAFAIHVTKTKHQHAKRKD